LELIDIMARHREEHELFPVRITDNVELSPGVFMISWNRNTSFVPGQVVKIAVNREIPPRIYSICSGNLDEKMSVLFDIKADGVLTPVLAKMREGMQLLVSKPYGSYTCDQLPAYWIATGTGIAPFYSMFRSGLEGITFIHGARYLNQFFFEEEFERKLGKNYIRCCSNEQSPKVYKGRITDYISQMKNLPKDFMYYLCGGGMMVIDVRDLLIEKGIPFGNILSEIYF
jgi:ferredoxin/flavodoxin---NADP+ reductase